MPEDLILPSWKVIANGNDISSKLRGRVISIRCTDATKSESDDAEILLDDTIKNPAIEYPDPGAELEIWMGYNGETAKIGSYIVDEINASGPPSQLSITARSSPNGGASLGTGDKTGMDTYKDRDWPAGKTLGDMVKTIAGEHGLTPAISNELAATVLPQLHQVAESDINLLTRVTHTYGAIAKPADGKLVVVKIEDSASVSGKALQEVLILPEQVTSWRAKLAQRGAAGTVIATWRDKDAAEDVDEKDGEGEPTIRLRHPFPDAATARHACKSDRHRRKRAKYGLNLTLPGDNRLIAGTPLTVDGIREGVDGKWLVRSVNHTIDSGGYRCDVECEAPKDGTSGAAALGDE